jgi:hypothetical protein
MPEAVRRRFRQSPRRLFAARLGRERRRFADVEPADAQRGRCVGDVPPHGDCPSLELSPLGCPRLLDSAPRHDDMPKAG